MNKDVIRSILEVALSKGAKTPNLLQLPKAAVLKAELEACTSTKQVVYLLQGEKKFFNKAFGISEGDFNNAIREIGEHNA